MPSVSQVIAVLLTTTLPVVIGEQVDIVQENAVFSSFRKLVDPPCESYDLVCLRRWRLGITLYFFISLFTAILWIGLPLWLYFKLKKRDATLPKDERYLQCDMRCIYWLTCLVCACTGTVLFFVQASNEIDRKRLMLRIVEHKETSEDSEPFLAKNKKNLLPVETKEHEITGLDVA